MTAAIDPKDLPPGVRPIPFDLIGKVKRDGTYKCRGIVNVKGYHMREGIDYRLNLIGSMSMLYLFWLLFVSVGFSVWFTFHLSCSIQGPTEYPALR